LLWKNPQKLKQNEEDSLKALQENLQSKEEKNC
jgi:hypothetical protein